MPYIIINIEIFLILNFKTKNLIIYIYMNKEDYDFVKVEVETNGMTNRYNFYVEKRIREYYKSKGFTTAGIIYFLINYGQINERFNVAGLRALRKDTVIQYNGISYAPLTTDDVALAMGKKRL